MATREAFVPGGSSFRSLRGSRSCFSLFRLDLPGLPRLPLASSGDEPPPIPTPEERLALIQAHPQIPPEMPARAIHDEYDVTHYDVDLRLDIPNHVITGEVQVHGTAEVADLSQVSLDLYTPMVVDAVTVNGAPRPFIARSGAVTVTLGHAYQPGQAFLIACTLSRHADLPGHAVPLERPRRGIPMVLTYSEPYGAPAWWLCKDDPKDKATFAIHVTAPDTLFTVSNGVLDSVIDNGERHRDLQLDARLPDVALPLLHRHHELRTLDRDLHRLSTARHDHGRPLLRLSGGPARTPRSTGATTSR